MWHRPSRPKYLPTGTKILHRISQTLLWMPSVSVSKHGQEIIQSVLPNINTIITSLFATISFTVHAE